MCSMLFLTGKRYTFCIQCTFKWIQRIAGYFPRGILFVDMFGIIKQFPILGITN